MLKTAKKPVKKVTKTPAKAVTKRVVKTVKPFRPSSIKLVRGNDLAFNDSIFQPMATGREIDTILSTEGGLMPGTNMVLVGGPGSGKTTVALDWIASLTHKGFKCLYVSAEMDEIAHYKYCKRMPRLSCVKTLFLKNYADNPKEVLEYVFNEGYDVIVVDSIAEVIEMYRDAYRTTESAAEFWFLNLQDKMKKGENKKKYYTTFVNIQQVTKGGEFAGSNRIKHMTDAMAHIERSKDGLERSIFFSKNRDCDKDFKLFFSIWKDDVFYSFEMDKEQA
jgi:predicted ATP-dependent serine protease